MENTGFYSRPNGSTPATGRQNSGLYDLYGAQSGQEVQRYTGDPETDEWINTFPEEERAEVIRKIQEPLTGKEIADYIDQDPSYRFTNERDFLAYTQFRAEENRSLIADLADGVANMTDIVTTAVTQVGDAPGEAALKFIPSVIEGAFQAGRDTFGLIAESTNPNSAVFKFRHALLGTGTIADQMAQTNKALEFNQKSNQYLLGEDTVVIDKDYINPGVTQIAAILADPSALLPLGKAAKFIGLNNVAMKGAKALGFGATMTEAAIKAQKIKTSIMAGTLQWGVGMPLDAIGGAVRGTIDYSVDSFGKVVEFTTGVSAADVGRATRLAGAGTATAGLAGVSIPVATTASTAYFGGSIAKGLGEAVAMVSEQMRKQGGHRGLFSYASEALAQTQEALAKTGGRMNPATEKMLKLIDKMDPLMAYGAEALGGVIQGGIIGGVLGGLNEGEKGIGFGAGMGAVGGALGATTGRMLADIKGATFRQRLMVSAEFARRLYHEKDPTSAFMLDRLYNDSRMNAESRKVLDLFSLALGKVDGQVHFRAMSAAEYPHYLAILAKQGLLANDPTPQKFRQADGFAMRRTTTGAIEVVIDTDKFFRKNGEGRFAVAHEFLHGFLMSSSLGDGFRAMFRDAVLGYRSPNGKKLSGGVIPISEFKEFVQSYHSQGGVNRIADVKKYLGLIDKWENQGKKGEPLLNSDEIRALETMTEEFAAYYFSAWFDGADAYFIASGGKLTGMRSLLDFMKNAWLDNLETRINLHQPMFPFTRTRNRKGDLTQAFFRDKKRIRVGALDYLIRDMYRMSSELRSRGSIDLNGMNETARKAFFERAGLDEIASKSPRGRWKPKSQAQQAADGKILGDSAEKILEKLDSSVRTSAKGPDGVIRGPFSQEELKALVDAGLISEGLAGKFSILQAMANDRTGSIPNTAEFGYLGAERGISALDDNARVSGDQVPYTNRRVLVIDAIGEVGGGKFSFRIRALDLKVIDRRMANMWADASVRALWNNDFSAMSYDFYNSYLRNASLPKNDIKRVPSELLWTQNGTQKRDVMHQIAGFAKAEELPYINTPIAQIPRGTMSAVTDFSVGRMHVVRPDMTGRLPYEHKNAFYDIAANFKFSATTTEETPVGKVHRSPTGYSYHERKGEVVIVDPIGEVVGRTSNATQAESIALSDFEKRYENMYDTLARDMFNTFAGPKYSFSNIKAAEDVANLVSDLPSAAVVDMPFDVFSVLLEENRKANNLIPFLEKTCGIDLEIRQGDNNNKYILEFASLDTETVTADGSPKFVTHRVDFFQDGKRFGVSLSARAKEALYTAMIIKAASASPEGIMALWFYHASLAAGLHRVKVFGENFFKRYPNGTVEPGVWGAASIVRTLKGPILRDGMDVEGNIPLRDFRTPGTVDTPMLAGLMKGELKIVTHNVPLWNMRWLVETAEGRSRLEQMNRSGLPGLDTINYDLLMRFAEAILGGSKDAVFKDGRFLAMAAYLKEQKSSYNPNVGLIDDINRHFTTPEAIKAQSEGKGILLMPHIGSRDPLDFLPMMALSENKYTKPSDIPTNFTPLKNVAIAESNTLLGADGKYVRNPESFIRFHEEAGPNAERMLGRRLSDFDLGRANSKRVRFSFSSVEAFAAPDMAPKAAEAFRQILDDIGLSGTGPKPLDPGITGVRDSLVASRKATYLTNEAAGRLKKALERIENEIYAQNPRLSEADYNAQIGEMEAKALADSKQLFFEANLFANFYTIASRLDDDFIQLMENGRTFVRSLMEGGDGIVRTGTMALDGALDPTAMNGSHARRRLSDNQFDTEHIAALQAFISTINQEVSDATNGYVEIKYIERRALTENTPYEADNPSVSYDQSTALAMRPTFVWTEKARRELGEFAQAIGVTIDAQFDNWRALLRDPELVAAIHRTDSPQRQANDKFARSLSEMRERTSRYYRAQNSKSGDLSERGAALRESLKSYEDYVESWESETNDKVAQARSRHIESLPVEDFINNAGSNENLRNQRHRAYINETLNILGEEPDMLGRVVDTQLRMAAGISEADDVIKRMTAKGVDTRAVEYLMLRWLSNEVTGLSEFKPDKAYEVSVIEAAKPYIDEWDGAMIKVGGINGLEAIKAISQTYASKVDAYKDVAYAGMLRSGIRVGIDEAMKKFPTGITAQNLIKELERVNSTGVPVLEEARVTGFMDFLKEKASLPRDKETGKFPKLDMEEVEKFIQANRLELVIGKNVRFDIDHDSLITRYIVKPAGKEKIGGGNFIVRSTDSRFFPGVGRGSHVRGTPGTGTDTYGWVRYTDRKNGKGQVIRYIEESQAQNNGTVRQALQVESDVMEQIRKEMTSPAGLAALDEFRQALASGAVLGNRRAPHDLISDVFQKTRLQSSYFNTNFLREAVRHMTQDLTPKEVSAFNSAVRPYAQIVSRYAAAQAEISGAMLSAITEGGIERHLSGHLIDDANVSITTLRNLVHRLGEDVNATAATVTVGDSKMSLGDWASAGINELATVNEAGDAMRRHKISESAPRFAAFMRWLGNEAVTPNTYGEIVKMYIKKTMTYIDHHHESMRNWDSAMEDVMIDAGFRQEVLNYLKENIASKRFEYVENGVTHVVEFRSTASVAAAIRDFYGRLTKDQNSQGKSNLYRANFFPEFVREAIKIQVANSRDRALVLLMDRLTRSSDAAAFLRADRDFSIPDWKNLPGKIPDVKPHEIIKSLMEIQNGTTSTSPYAVMFDMVSSILQKNDAFSNVLGDGAEAFITERGIPFIDRTDQDYYRRASQRQPGFYSIPSHRSQVSALIETNFLNGSNLPRPGYIAYMEAVKKYMDTLGDGPTSPRSVLSTESTSNNLPTTLLPLRPGLNGRSDVAFRINRFDGYHDMSLTDAERAGAELMIDFMGIVEDVMSTPSARSSFVGITRAYEIVSNSADGGMPKNYNDGMKLLGQMSPNAVSLVDSAREKVFYRNRPFEQVTLSGNAPASVKLAVQKMYELAAAGEPVDKIYDVLRSVMHTDERRDMLKILSRVPFLEGKEYFTLLGKTALIGAIRDGVDGIALLAPADGASNSGLDYEKGIEIYGSQLPNFWGNAFKKAGFKVEPFKGLEYNTWLPRETHDMMWKAVRDAHAERIKALSKFVSIKSSAELGPTYILKPEYQVAVARFADLLMDRDASTSMFVEDNSKGIYDGNLNSNFTGIIETVSKNNSAGKHGGGVPRPDSEKQTRVTPVNRDPVGDVFAASAMHIIKGGLQEGEIQRLRDSAANNATSTVLGPVFGWLTANFDKRANVVMPDGARKQVIQFVSSSHHSTSGRVAELSVALLQALDSNLELMLSKGDIPAADAAKIKDMISYGYAAVKEVGAHKEVSHYLKVRTMEAQQVVSAQVLESGGFSKELHKQAGPHSNNTDVLARGFFVDLTGQPDAVKNVNEKGMFMMKPSADEPGGNMVGMETRAFHGGFISTMASALSDLSSRARIYVAMNGDDTGANMSVSLYPRGEGKMNDEGRPVEVNAVVDPASKTAAMIVASADTEGKFVDLAKAELDTRLRAFGYTVLDDGFNSKPDAPMYSLSGFDSVYSNHTPQGREVIDRLNAAGGSLAFGEVASRTVTKTVNGEPTVCASRDCKISIKNRDGRDGMNIIVTIEPDSRNDLVAKVKSQKYDGFKFDYLYSQEKASEFMTPEEALDYKFNYTKDHSEIKQVMLAELMHRLVGLGVARIEGLEKFVERNLDQPVLGDPVEIDTGFGERLLDMEQKKMMTYEDAAEVLRPQNVRSSMNPVGEEPRMSARIPKDTMYKPTGRSWSKGMEGDTMTVTSSDGYFIAFKNRKYRLFSPQRAMLGVYENEDEAKRKAEAHSRKGRR